MLHYLIGKDNRGISSKSIAANGDGWMDVADRFPAELTLPSGSVAAKLSNGLRYYIVSQPEDAATPSVNMRFIARVCIYRLSFRLSSMKWMPLMAIHMYTIGW